MTLPAGKTEYQEIHNGITIKGFSYAKSDIQQSAQSIADVCFDASGQNDFKDFIASLSETGFNDSRFFSCGCCLCIMSLYTVAGTPEILILSQN